MCDISSMETISTHNSDKLNPDDIWDIYNDLMDDSVINENIKEDNKKNENKCVDDNCNSRDFILDDGYYVCKECNTIQEKFIDNGAEWRYYGMKILKQVILQDVVCLQVNYCQNYHLVLLLAMILIVIQNVLFKLIMEFQRLIKKEHYLISRIVFHYKHLIQEYHLQLLTK